jgi:nitrogen fixation protein
MSLSASTQTFLEAYAPWSDEEAPYIALVTALAAQFDIEGTAALASQWRLTFNDLRKLHFNEGEAPDELAKLLRR